MTHAYACIAARDSAGALVAGRSITARANALDSTHVYPLPPFDGMLRPVL